MPSAAVFVAVAAALAGRASAQSTPTGAAAAPAATGGTCGGNGLPLTQQVCPWPYNGPDQVDNQATATRGPMQGTNICNATTQNQGSSCVNAVINGIDDFCIYAPPQLQTIGEGEGETVAYCVKSGYGTRLIPEGAIAGIQVVKTPGYLAFGIQLSNQELINITAGDTGGELDPHGADLRGNPIGGIVYSNAFGVQPEGQISEWHMFLGSNMVCMKICDPSFTAPNGANLCENRYDTIGCMGNIPLDYPSITGKYEYCLGENQDPPVNATVALPIPATSSCTPYASTDLFKNAFVATGVPTSSAASSSATITSAATTTSVRSGDAIRTASSSTKASGSSSGSAVALGQIGFPLSGAVLTAGAALVGAAALFL